MRENWSKIYYKRKPIDIIWILNVFLISHFDMWQIFTHIQIVGFDFYYIRVKQIEYLKLNFLYMNHLLILFS